MVVIAIIIILAAILFPAFQRVRENARRVSCQGNMKQLALGVAQYFQDNDDRPPLGSFGLDSAHPWHMGQGWAGQVYPYVKSAATYKCPNDAGKASATTVPVSYAINQNLVLGAGNVCNLPPLSIMTAPTRTILLTEGTSPPTYNKTYNLTMPGADFNSPSCNGIYFNNDGANSGSAWCEAGKLSDQAIICGSFQSLASPPTTGWHTEGSNFAFFDGHVKWLLGSSVSPGNNPATAGAVQTAPGGSRFAAGTNGLFANGTAHQGTYSIF